MRYILDRNYIIEIDKFISGENFDAETISKAKKLDVKENFVSALSSIFEGSTHSANGDDIRKDALREAEALGKFFKNARTDSDFFRGNLLEASLSLQDHKNNEGRNELDSFSRVKKFLGRENSKNNSWSKFKDLIDFKESDESVWGMAYIAATASIFGHQGARDVLKLNKAPSSQLDYNSYSDLKTISIVPTLEYMHSQMNGGKKIKLVFKTNDKGLISFRNSCVFNRIESRSRIYGNDYKFSIDLNKFIADLPFVSKNKKQELIDQLVSF